MRIQSSTQALSGIGQVLGRATRTLSRCLVCGFRELRTDEVVDRVPGVRRYRYIVAQDDIVIVDPNDHAVALVISE